ncbi:hypothetical protein [Catenulispora subtropica]|uniref:Secreted protein n=1 Tax=Catenulispora subtropica TaxID=450798 RepID=A0ABP5DUY4_9ACTN
MSRLTATAATLSLTFMLFAGQTGAAGAADASGTGDLRTAAAHDCQLIKDLQPVVADLLATVDGDATTPGSSAWLNAQAARAKAAGRTQLATWLSERATLRQEQGTVLKTRQELLGTGLSWCTAHGFGAGA